MKKVLAVVAHPDDDIIGCGGSLIEHVLEGDHVAIAYLTSGESGSSTIAPDELKKIRPEEARKAAGVLGIDDTTFFGYRDGHLMYDADPVNQVIRILREKRPDTLYVHAANDLHSDHRIAHEICMQAIFGAPGNHYGISGTRPWHVPTVLAFEVWTPHQNPQLVVDITDVMDKKLQALLEHKSQVVQTRYDEAVEGLARYRGVMSGAGRYAEAFEVIRIGKI
ncbi:PIG-L family deacetylase [Candidatus Woesearchaeota archaeon]|nr:PIG-L family deacetylase [Candidatus Woesearchaeota archaeon]